MKNYRTGESSAEWLIAVGEMYATSFEYLCYFDPQMTSWKAGLRSISLLTQVMPAIKLSTSGLPPMGKLETQRYLHTNVKNVKAERNMTNHFVEATVPDLSRRIEKKISWFSESIVLRLIVLRIRNIDAKLPHLFFFELTCQGILQAKFSCQSSRFLDRIRWDGDNWNICLIEIGELCVKVAERACEKHLTIITKPKLSASKLQHQIHTLDTRRCINGKYRPLQNGQNAPR